MRHTPNPNCPTCPACRARHYPATTGAGFRVWCDGSSAESAEQRAKVYARNHAEQERARAEQHERDTIRAERSALAERPKIEAWEIVAPDSLPLEF